MRRFKLLALTLAALGLGVVAGNALPARAAKTSTRQLIFFEPGTNWDYGGGLRGQSGYGKHVLYFRKVFKKKKVTLAGTVKGKDLFLLLGDRGATRSELRAIAAADPLVKAQVLTFKVRAWKLDYEGKVQTRDFDDELSDVDLDGY